jgi:hypothetical protein
MLMLLNADEIISRLNLIVNLDLNTLDFQQESIEYLSKRMEKKKIVRREPVSFIIRGKKTEKSGSCYKAQSIKH